MKIKNTAKRLMAALLCVLMVVSSFAVIPAMAEDTVTGTSTTGASSDGAGTTVRSSTANLVGIDNLLAVSAAGGAVDFNDYDSATGESIQDYIWRKTGIYFTELAKSTLSGLSMVDDGNNGLRPQFTCSGNYANTRFSHNSSSDLENYIDGKNDGNSAFLDLINGETGPSKFSLTMDFVIADTFPGTADENNEANYALTKQRGFSLIDFGGGWALKATAPGTGAVAIETTTTIDETTNVSTTTPKKYNSSGVESDTGTYYKVTSVTNYFTVEAADGEELTDAQKTNNENAKIGYIYPNQTGKTSNYVFEAGSKMGWSSNAIYLGKVTDDDDTANIKRQYTSGSNTVTEYYTNGRCTSAIAYQLIDGNEENGEAFQYTAGEPFTLRFDFVKTKVAGDNNDTVAINIYGVREDEDDVLIGTKNYKTSQSVKNYGFRINDISTSKLQIDNISLVIAEDSEYICGGDHDSYWSQCKATVENLPGYLEFTYECGAVEHVDYIIQNEIENVVPNAPYTLENPALTGSINIQELGFSDIRINTKTKDSYAAPSAQTTLIRLGGTNILRVGTDGVLTIHKNDGDNTGTSLGVTLEKSKTYALKIVTSPVSGNKYDVDFYIDGVLKGSLEGQTFYSARFVPYPQTGIEFSDGIVYVDNDFVFAAEINTRKDYATPTADTALISIGGASLLTLTTDGKLTLADGTAVLEGLKSIRTYSVAARLIPSNDGYDYVLYVNGNEAGRAHVSVVTSDALTFTAANGTHINNIKAATLKSSTAYPTTALSGISSAENTDATPCLHRDPLSLTAAATGTERTFYTVPLVLNNSSGATQGVNSLWYSYDCYYCGERVYTEMGENLYNSNKSDYQAYYYAKSATNSTVTNTDKRTNTTFDGDGIRDYDTSGTMFLIYTNANVTKSGGTPYWLNFTINFDTISLASIVAKGNGGNFFNVMANFTSPLRAYAVKPYEKGTTTPISKNTDLSKIERYTATSGTAGTDYSSQYMLLQIKDSTNLVLVEEGDSVDFTFYVNGSSSRIWVNGVLRATGGTGLTGSSADNNGYAFRFMESKNYGTGSLSNFSFVLDDRAEETHEHTDAYDSDKSIVFSDDGLNYTYDCYCGAHVTEVISGVVKNNIANLYNGYGKVDFTAPEDGKYWVTSDINIRSGEITEGALLTLGENVILNVEDLGTVTAPTTVTAAVKVNGTSYELYLDNEYVKSGELTGEITSVTYGAEDAYDSYVRFKYNKIVTLGTTASTEAVTFTDEPEGAICYHEGSVLKFTGKSHANVFVSGGIALDATDANGAANNVLGMKSIKARYICSLCGESVYAEQNEALEVNFKPTDGYAADGTSDMSVDSNGSSTVTSAKVIHADFDDVNYGNSYWLSFDLTVDVTSAGISNLMDKSQGGSLLAIRAPYIQKDWAVSKEAARYWYAQFLRGYSVIRPDAETNSEGKYTIEDYYDDRIGVWYDSEPKKKNVPEDEYLFVMMEGQTYSIDICFEVNANGKMTFTTYVDGNPIRTNNLTSDVLDPNRDDTVPEDTDFSTITVNSEVKSRKDYLVDVSDKEYTDVYPFSFRFTDGGYSNFTVNNLSIVKKSAGEDDYSEDTVVFELSATKPTEAGVLASAEGVTLLSANADGQLVAANGALISSDYTDEATPITLGETETKIAIVYNGVNIRYYVDGASAYAGGAVTVTVELSEGTDLKATQLEVGATVTVSDVYGAVGNAEADYITFQSHSSESNQIRIISGVDMLYYNNVGYRIVTKNGDKVTSVERTSGTVYSSVEANGSTVNADRFGHRYFSLMKITDLANPEASETYELYVTPFTTVGIGETVSPKYSTKTAKITVTVGSEASCIHELIDTADVPEVTETEATE